MAIWRAMVRRHSSRWMVMKGAIGRGGGPRSTRGPGGLSPLRRWSRSGARSLHRLPIALGLGDVHPNRVTELREGLVQGHVIVALGTLEPEVDVEDDDYLRGLAWGFGAAEEGEIEGTGFGCGCFGGFFPFGVHSDHSSFLQQVPSLVQGGEGQALGEEIPREALWAEVWLAGMLRVHGAEGVQGGGEAAFAAEERSHVGAIL